MTGQDSKIHEADQCLDMVDLRFEIDRLDRSLVKLLSERQRYIERAAEIKSRRSDIHDQSRIEDVLKKVADAAEKAGLDAGLARAVWQTLMERSIEIELARFDAQRLM